MEIIKNLEFQERNFNHIYKSYFDKERRLTEQDESASPVLEIHDKILIYTDDFVPILREVFHFTIPESELQEYNDYTEVMIVDQPMERREVDTFNQSCTLALTHSYHLKHYRISLVNKINRKHLKGVCKVLTLNRLDIFSQRALRGIPVENISEKRTEDQISLVKDYLIQFKYYYNEYNEMEGSLVANNLPNEHIQELLNDFDSVLGLEVVNQIIADPTQTLKTHFNKYKRRIMQEFHNYAIPILENLMTKGTFTRNFQLVNLYFSKEKALQRRLAKVFDEEIVPDLLQSNQSDETRVRLLIQSVRRYADQIDEVLRETVVEFKETVFDTI